MITRRKNTMHKSFTIRKGDYVRLNRHPSVGIVLRTFPRTEMAKVMFPLCTRIEEIASLTKVPDEDIEYTQCGPMDSHFKWC
jgi:hypothetical protein